MTLGKWFNHPGREGGLTNEGDIKSATIGQSLCPGREISLRKYIGSRYAESEMPVGHPGENMWKVMRKWQARREPYYTYAHSGVTGRWH